MNCFSYCLNSVQQIYVLLLLLLLLNNILTISLMSRDFRIIDPAGLVSYLEYSQLTC